MLCVNRVKVRWRVIRLEHTNNDPIKSADLRHPTFPLELYAATREMRQRLLNFAFNACVGLFVLFAVTWPITHTVGYTGVFAWRERAILLDTCRGEISFWTAPVVATKELGAGEAHVDNSVYDRNLAATTREWFRASKMEKSGVF